MGLKNCPRGITPILHMKFYLVTAVPLTVPTYVIFENTRQVQQISRPAEKSVAGQLIYHG